MMAAALSLTHDCSRRPRPTPALLAVGCLSTTRRLCHPSPTSATSTVDHLLPSLFPVDHPLLSDMAAAVARPACDLPAGAQAAQGAANVPVWGTSAPLLGKKIESSVLEKKASLPQGRVGAGGADAPLRRGGGAVPSQGAARGLQPRQRPCKWLLPRRRPRRGCRDSSRHLSSSRVATSHCIAAQLRPMHLSRPLRPPPSTRAPVCQDVPMTSTAHFSRVATGVASAPLHVLHEWHFVCSGALRCSRTTPSCTCSLDASPSLCCGSHASLPCVRLPS